jgi:NTP pyrophosphatase (non-canonical NTP hydrolase)
MITYEDLTDMGYYDKGQSYSTPMDMVREFKETAKQPTNIEMSRKLIREEFDEWLIEVLNPNGNKSAELKELSDLVYVIYGYALNMGWDLNEAVTRVHENNMERMTQDDGTIKRREDGKIIKNPNTPKVQLGDLV